MRYWYPNNPMRLDPDSPFFDELDHDIRYGAEIKKNGWRMLAMKSEGKLELWTKNRTLIEDPLPEIRAQLAEMIPDESIFDGELIEKRTKTTKGKVYLFDVIMTEGQLITSLALAERRKKLYNFITETPEIELAFQYLTGKKQLYCRSIEGEVNEGIVIKRLDSPYLISPYKCLDNPAWIKVKRVEAHVRIA